MFCHQVEIVNGGIAFLKTSNLVAKYMSVWEKDTVCFFKKMPRGHDSTNLLSSFQYPFVNTWLNL